MDKYARTKPEKEIIAIEKKREGKEKKEKCLDRSDSPYPYMESLAWRRPGQQDLAAEGGGGGGGGERSLEYGRPLG